MRSGQRDNQASAGGPAQDTHGYLSLADQLSCVWSQPSFGKTKLTEEEKEEEEEEAKTSFGQPTRLITCTDSWH